MDLSIIIVNWNVRELLIRCLESIFKQTKDLNYEIIVVDNASNDNSVSALRKNFAAEILAEKLLVIENKQNNGFAKANNQGLNEARGKYILFMNPDMEFIDNTALKLKQKMDSDPKIGIATCTLIYADKTVQPNIKNNPTFFSQLLIELKLHHWFKRLPCVKKYLAKDFNYQKESAVSQVMGAFVFTSKKLMKQIRGWDEDYWLWWEDVDLCKRVRDLNYKIIYFPISQVIHYEGKSFEQVASVKKQKRFIKGMMIYFRKHHHRSAYYILKFFYPLSILLSYLTQILKIKPTPQSRI